MLLIKPISAWPDPSCPSRHFYPAFCAIHLMPTDLQGPWSASFSAYTAVLVLSHHSQITAVATSSGKSSLILLRIDPLSGVLVAPCSLQSHILINFHDYLIIWCLSPLHCGCHDWEPCAFFLPTAASQHWAWYLLHWKQCKSLSYVWVFNGLADRLWWCKNYLLMHREIRTRF